MFNPASGLKRKNGQSGWKRHPLEKGLALNRTADDVRGLYLK
jgi:hypothetical protein